MKALELMNHYETLYWCNQFLFTLLRQYGWNAMLYSFRFKDMVIVRVHSGFLTNTWRKPFLCNLTPQGGRLLELLTKHKEILSVLF